MDALVNRVYVTLNDVTRKVLVQMFQSVSKSDLPVLICAQKKKKKKIAMAMLKEREKESVLHIFEEIKASSLHWPSFPWACPSGSELPTRVKRTTNKCQRGSQSA